MSIVELAKHSGLTPKRVRKEFKQIRNSGGVYFTIYLNPSSLGMIHFFIFVELDEKKADPSDVVIWLQKRYPLEYWNSFILANDPLMMNFFTGEHVRDVERITLDVKDAAFSIRVDSHIQAPNKIFPSLARIKLLEMLDEAGA
jgi:hypothetical protein